MGVNMKHYLPLICAILLGSFACSQQARQRFAEGFAAGVQKQGEGSTLTKLMIFGGKNHDVYLGCLTCSESDSDSVHNEYGSYGSSYSTSSIFNRYGDYGSQYGTFSACNPYASDPPVIVDSNGNFYGYLT